MFNKVILIQKPISSTRSRKRPKHQYTLDFSETRRSISRSILSVGMTVSVTANSLGRIRPRSKPANEKEPPGWILDKILDLLAACNGGESLQLQEISRAKSAQQEVFVLRFTNDSHNNNKNNNNFRPKYNNNDDDEWINALSCGKQRLVLRIWRGGSRWWNLNRNEDPLELAKSEVHGYRVAFRALQDYHTSTRCSNSAAKISGVPKIPRVLHFHLPKDTMCEGESFVKGNNCRVCWALLEYVGADETDCLTATTRTTTTTTTTTSDSSDHRTTADVAAVKIDRSYLDGMIKIRREFGFDEPHPRWGRVPVDQALEYASSITKHFLLPLHLYSRKLYPKTNNQERKHSVHQECSSFERTVCSDNVRAKTFSGMVELYRKAYEETNATIQENVRIQHPNPIHGRDNRIEECLQHLDRGISSLSKIARKISHLDPVLLHLDLQPQNLIFYSHDGVAQSTTPSVFSVLDWEDAAWGDPRFDLVLLCRKVCANRDQADALWSEYGKVMAASDGVMASDTKIASGEPKRILIKNDLFLGPIEPWLRMETVHSITTMLLQSMDLVNGGRNPWETKKDLWGKLEREFTRLEAYEGAC